MSRSDRIDWQLGPWEAVGEVLAPTADLTFICPVTGAVVAWAAKDLFNPAAVVRNGRVHLLVRAEDAIGAFSGTSRLGLAISDDGVNFAVEPEPVLFPANDKWHSWEWPGGCEDPRVVESPDGGYVCCYSAFDGTTSRLFVATSEDLRHWEKHGPAFTATPLARRWSKSGSIVTERREGRLVASRIDGRFVMYWGEGTCFMATSDDLLRWTPQEFDPDADRYLEPGEGGGWRVHRVDSGRRAGRPVLMARRGRFDSVLVEPGPPAVLTDDGIVLVYNGAELLRDAGGTPIGVRYRPGQALLDPAEPGSVLARSIAAFLGEESAGDLDGQASGVCFAEGLVWFGEEWLLYYGMGDSRIGCARARPPTADPG